MVSVGVAVLTIRNEMKQKTSMGMQSIAALTLLYYKMAGLARCENIRLKELHILHHN
jgi:hypothetical protein